MEEVFLFFFYVIVSKGVIKVFPKAPGSQPEFIPAKSGAGMTKIGE